ncbi:MAG: hypothetical protein P9L96_04395 [Candidatus Gygaella obscura]|nr:hypothetical protein [Candidatus Gygaella obscura]
MNTRFLRVWKELDLNDVKEHIAILGIKSAICQKCKNNIADLSKGKCDSCNSQIKYITFRQEIVEDPSFFVKLKVWRKQFICVDYKDYNNMTARMKAEEIFKKES